MKKIFAFITILFLWSSCEKDPLPSTPVSIENIEATSIDYTSAIIKFSISGNTNKAGVTYGADKELSSTTIQYSDKTSGSISISLEDLNQGMEYFYSVFAEDKRGNKISSETKNFITKSSSITTGDAMNVTTESAKLTMSFKGADIDEAGIVYTTDALCKENLVTVSKADPVDSNLEFAINELDAGTTYYYKAFIKYNNGTIQYGEIKSFQTVEQSLKVSTTTIETAAEGGTYQFDIEAKNVEWNILCEADWCTIEPTSGTGNATITVIVKENPYLELRSASIVINGNIHVVVNQQATIIKESSLLLSTIGCQLEWEELHSHYFTVLSDEAWTVSTDVSWCTVQTPSGRNNGLVYFSVTKNSSQECRIATITVQTKSDKQKFVVLQNYSYNPIRRPEFYISFGGFELSKLNSPENWQAVSDQDWCIVVTSSGFPNDPFKVRTDANRSTKDRFAIVSITSGFYESKWVIAQYKEKTYSMTSDIPPYEVVEVKGGTFNMGSNSYENAKPVHRVTLDDFYIGKYEVTQKLWSAIMGNNPSSYRGDDMPVSFMSKGDIQMFITRLNKITGLNYRLPTEAEWEYAAKGRQLSHDYKFSGSNNFDDVGWNTQSRNNPPVFVGAKSPNELGIYDMSGNIWEYCSDKYGVYSLNHQYNPTGPEEGDYDILKGVGDHEIGYRQTVPTDRVYEYGGFRLVLDK